MDDPLGCCTNPALHLLAANTNPSVAGAVDPSVLGVLLAAAFVVVFSALASMTEAAFLSLSYLKAEEMLESSSKAERLAGRLRLRFTEPLSTIVVINNIANVAGSSLVGLLASNFFKAQGWPEQTAAAIFFSALTMIVIVFGEIVPKTLGETYRVSITKFTAYPLAFLQTALRPITWFTGLAQKPLRRVRRGHVTSEEEITRLSSMGHAQGAIEAGEHELIKRVFQLNDTTAEDIMTPRVAVELLPANSRLGDVAEDLFAARHTRIPLYGETMDDIHRVLDRPDALAALASGKQDLLLSDPSITFAPFIAPETMPADDLLLTLRRRTEPLAVIVGEYGDCVGIATLDDVLEELVGDIRDEADDDITEIRQVSEDVFDVLGPTELSDVNRVLGTHIPNHRTVAGLLLEELERIPKAGATVRVRNLEFTVTEVSDRAILKVRLTRCEVLEDEDDSDDDDDGDGDD